MSAQDIVILIGGVCTLLTAFGAACRWALGYIDRKAKEAEVREIAAREELKQLMGKRIDALETTVQQLTASNGLYLRRVLQLEAFIQGQKGLVMPQLAGWPPQ